MTTQFDSLFTLGVSHAYYTAECSDFDFAIPAEMASLMRNGRLITRVNESVLYVLFEAIKKNRPVISLEGRMLRIGLKLLNPFFSNFTKFDYDPREKIMVVTNAPSRRSLRSPKKAILVGELFSHTVDDTSRPVTVILRDADDRIAGEDTLTSTDDRTSVDFNLAGRAAGLYTLEETYTGKTVSTRYYVDAEMLRLGVFAVVEVVLDDKFYSSPPDFRISFKAKEQTLKYYVLAKNFTDTDFEKLSVSDEGYLEDSRDQVSFTKVSSETLAGRKDPALLMGDDDTKLTLFESETSLHRQETVRKKIQLKKNGDVVMANLPHPAPNSINSEFIIQLTKP